MSNALAEDTPRKAIDPPNSDVIACRRAITEEDESNLFAAGTL
jgi:hypothetical protein